jgi:hypothetical protein
MPAKLRRVIQGWSPTTGIVVVVASPSLRQTIVDELALGGHRAWSTGSIEETMELVETGEVDAVVLHVSAFSTTLVSRLAGAIRKQGAVSLIASVSVVSVVERSLKRGRGTRKLDRVAVQEPPRWRTTVYWLPFSCTDHLGQGLYGCVLN